MSELLAKIQFWRREIPRRVRLRLLRDALQGPNAERYLAELKVPGVGTHLIRHIFPVPLPASEKPKLLDRSGKLSKLLQDSLATAETFLPALQTSIEPLLDHARESGTGRGSILNNDYLPPFDALLLWAMLSVHEPRRYIEIGSGFSTRVVRGAIDKKGSNTTITCIDPNPRVEVSDVCDRLIKGTLQSAAPGILDDLQSGDMVFFDGSHAAYPHSDVVHFFFRVLTRCPPGVVVHLHDIYLPWEYAREAAAQYWSEQYVLAAWLVGGGQNLKVLFPAYFSTSEQRQVKGLAAEFANSCAVDSERSPIFKRGCSFWVATL